MAVGIAGLAEAYLILLNCAKAGALYPARMAVEHGHSPEEITRRLSEGRKYNPLRDMVYGGIDGAVTTFAIVAGVEGASLSHNVIVALGLANILADGFSMAASNYSGTKAELDDRNRIIRIEERHIAENPQGEREELRQILALQGLSGALLQDATDAIAQSKENWIRLMLTDEYGLARDEPHPVRAALATFLAFLVAGAVPLVPFVFGLPNPFTISVYATLTTFFLIGAAKSRWSLSKWWRSGADTLVIGGLAALLAYVIGGLVHPG